MSDFLEYPLNLQRFFEARISHVIGRILMRTRTIRELSVAVGRSHFADGTGLSRFHLQSPALSLILGCVFQIFSASWLPQVPGVT